MNRGLRLFTFVLATTLTGSLFAQQTVASLAENFDSLKLGDSKAVSGTVFKQGNIEITFRTGSAAPVMVGKDVIGYFYKGSGIYTYKVADKDEAVVAASNAKRASNLGFDDSAGTISDNFSSVLIWGGGVTLPQLEGTTAGEPAGPAFDRHNETFGADVNSTPGVHQFMLQRLNAPKNAFVRAEFDGAKDEAVYIYDDVDRKMETLYALQRGEGRVAGKMMFAVPLSDHPIGRPLRSMPEPRFQLTDIDYTLVGDGSDAKLTMTQTYTGTRSGMSALRLDLINVMYDDTVARELRVKSAKDEKGNELSVDHRNGELIVGLPVALGPNAKAKVTYEIVGDFLIRPSGDSFWQLGTLPWFPQPDLVEQFYTVHSIAKVKKPFVPFAPGETIKRSEEGDFNVVENRIDKPIQFAVLHAGKYAVEEETRNGLTIRVASYAGKNTRAMKQLTNLAFGIIEYYQFFLGPFPFPELNIIEMNTWGYGQAPPGTMFITKEAFNPTLGEINQLFSQGINERFAHEIAHQYWGHVVKMPSGEDQWITESFAEYSAAIFLKKLKKDGTYESLVRHWQKNASDASKYSSILTANRIRIRGDGLTQIIARQSLVYDKGAYMLAALHKEMGDQMFLSFLKSYQTNFRWKFGSTESVAAVLQFINKKDYTPFFNDYYWGTKMPEVSLK